ncbi:endonuclease domain-containing protein [Pontibacter sp. BT310]|uniref:Endonuclease domain-containing protein n=1 Tax=Pontibacter populi TaxID=890055 RepID=A0ABS6X668_9BACT|nr:MULTISPECIES: endonuclease domain-containing protein [Pontibacter]MBJ6116639.1 endonuclease domain-containing protein [Pontibacter sp. BT310]MBR0569063.1 endonuclease domain-containing protein [Microvirga sp. STS03]MBW3363493.1 endonuclease domain-containing protein [Pontibacter populi]
MTKNRIIPYREDLKAKARELRRNSSLSEILLWQEIKERKLFGYQFHRQVPMLDFIVDFYSHELQLAIEIDGDSHDKNYKYDVKRQSELEQYGVQFVRFDDMEVKRNISNVLRTLKNWIRENQSP